MLESFATAGKEPEAGQALAAFLSEQREGLLYEWAAQVRARLPVLPAGPPRPLLLDVAHALLERLAEQRAPPGAPSRTEPDEPDEPGAHLPGPQLAGLAEVSEPEDLLAELSLLRAALLSRLEHTPQPLPRAAITRLDAAFDEELAALQRLFSRARARAHAALEQVVRAGAAPPRAGLNLLVRTLTEGTAVLDWAAVHAAPREQEGLRTLASAGGAATPGALARQALREGRALSTHGPSSRASGGPSSGASSEAAPEAPEGTQVLLTLPLAQEGRVLGVLQVGSRSSGVLPRSAQRLVQLAAGTAGALLARLALSERPGAEAERAEQDTQLLRMLVEQSSDGIIVADAAGALRICNRQAERQLGRPMMPMPMHRWPEAYDISTMEGERAQLGDLALARALEGQPVRNCRCRVRHPDGTLHTLQGDASPIFHPDGRVAGAVLTSRDETEREGLEAGLLDSEERFRAVFEGAAVGIAIADMQGRFLRTNPALQRLLGYSDEELREHTLMDVTPAQELAAERPLLQQLRQGLRETYQVERHFLHKEGRLGACRLTLSLGHGSDGEPRFLIGLVEDLSERRRAEELERAAEFRERFMGILGHDLRNPLNAIALSGQRLLQQPLPAPQARSVHRITHSAERMGRMVSDLLDFARARLGGGVPIVRRWVDLHELARNAVDELCVAHPDCRAELHVEGNVWGWWDADRMAQVLSNLLGNARQYRAGDTPIRMHLRGEGSEVRMAVCNQGGLIPPDLLPHLFDPFRRGGEGSPAAAGHGFGHGHNLGLGLFIVQQVVEAHGGSIEVRSTEQDGTRFLVRWPRNPPAQALSRGG